MQISCVPVRSVWEIWMETFVFFFLFMIIGFVNGSGCVSCYRYSGGINGTCVRVYAHMCVSV